MINYESIKFYPRNIRQRITGKMNLLSQELKKTLNPVIILILMTSQWWLEYNPDYVHISRRSYKTIHTILTKTSITFKLRIFLVLKTSAIKNAYSTRKYNFIFFIYLVILDKKLNKFIWFCWIHQTGFWASLHIPFVWWIKLEFITEEVLRIVKKSNKLIKVLRN